MQSSLRMEMKYPSLTKEDCDLMVQNLEVCLSTFEKGLGRLSASEIRVKSMISALRSELQGASQSAPPIAS